MSPYVCFPQNKAFLGGKHSVKIMNYILSFFFFDRLMFFTFFFYIPVL